MSGIWGSNYKISIFGESHGKAIGVVIDGLPPGLEIDFEYINSEMERRAPGKGKLTTQRRELDKIEIVSGYFNNKTTGTPLCVLIWNEDKKSKDYEAIKNIMRPGHADYTGFIKYKGHNDYRGGGHFSGRLTAPLVFAGALAKMILRERGIMIGGHIYSIGDIKDKSFDYCKVNSRDLVSIGNKEFPVIEDLKGDKMQELIFKIKEAGDSIGGIVEIAAINTPIGLGEPFFNSFEGSLAQIIFSIPGVKGVEFGAGFQISKMKGSQARDEYYYEDNKIKTYANNNGGILGGITNGMPIVFRVAFKPTPSIKLHQKSIDIKTKESIDLEIKGRHDPCIVPRALPVVEACTAIAILDFLLKDGCLK